MKTTVKNTMYEQIEKHGNNLNQIFNTGLDNITLCKKLHSLERKAHDLCIIECNTGKDMDNYLDKIMLKVHKILFPNKESINKELVKAVFLNGDPRGYALKIKSEYVASNNLDIYKDWGGYGIIAPDFSPNN